jgi:hypothetical protein
LLDRKQSGCRNRCAFCARRRPTPRLRS